MNFRKLLTLSWLIIAGCTGATPNPVHQSSDLNSSPDKLNPQCKSLSVLVVERHENTTVDPIHLFFNPHPEMEAVIKACRDSGIFSAVGHDVYRPDLIADIRIFVNKQPKEEGSAAKFGKLAGSVLVTLAGIPADFTSVVTRVVVKITILDSHGKAKGVVEKGYETVDRHYDLKAIIYELVRLSISEAHSQELL